jgi:hypothetical protein
VLLGACCLYSITVEGTAESEIPHAVRFARRLAQTLDGAVLDQQTDEVWSRSKSRRVQRPAREKRVAAIDVAWYCLREELTSNPAVLFVEAAQRTLPEALPRRFGEYEPLQGKWADAGADGFFDAWSTATSSLLTTGSLPCTDGYLNAGPGAQFADRFWSMSLTFLADPILEPGWRTALRTLFVALADGFPAFYASAELTEGYIWSGRSLWSDGNTQSRIVPVRHLEGWTGLPPRPTWWSWLGRPFAEYYASLPSDRATPTSRGVFYEAAEDPYRSGDLVSLGTWLPADLFASLAPNPQRVQPVPLQRAKVIPTDLQPSKG